MKKKLFLLVIAGLLIHLSVSAQKVDQTYIQKIREFTTDERFLPQNLLDVVDHPHIPSPLKHFGHIIGAEGQIHRSEEIFNYMTPPNFTRMFELLQ